MECQQVGLVPEGQLVLELDLDLQHQACPCFKSAAFAVANAAQFVRELGRCSHLQNPINAFRLEAWE